MPDPNLHQQDPSGTGFGLAGLLSAVAIGLWEALRYATRAIRFPRAKSLENGSLEKLKRLEVAFNQHRDVEFPAHAARIRSLELAAREIQDRQNEMLDKLDTAAGEQRQMRHILRSIQEQGEQR